MRIGLSALIVLVLIAATAFAADMYSVNSGATAQIDEHGVCQRITNSHGSGLPIMVPTRTASEWTTFRNNRPAGVGMAACTISGFWWRSTHDATSKPWCAQTTMGSSPCDNATANYPSGSASFLGMDHPPTCKAWMDITSTGGTVNQNSPSGWFCNANPKVLCAYFNSIGLLPDDIYAADIRYARQFVPASVNRGYRLWAAPITAYLERNPDSILIPILRPLVVGWAEEMAYRMGVVEESNWIGKALIMVGMPVSKAIAWTADTYTDLRSYLSLQKEKSDVFLSGMGI